MTRCFAVLLLSGSLNACDGSSPAAAPTTARSPESSPSASGAAANGEHPASLPAETRHTTLTIEGMVCQSCADAVEESLKRVEGVISAKADLQLGTAMVAFDPSKTSVDALAATIEAVDRDPAPPFRVTARS